MLASWGVFDNVLINFRRSIVKFHVNNLFANIPKHADQECFTTLLEKTHCKIERIVSYGQSSPEGFWYDQAQDEWVLLIQGEAELDVDGQMVRLVTGDYLMIKAGVRHRVVRTAADTPTIWLTVHC